MIRAITKVLFFVLIASCNGADGVTEEKQYEEFLTEIPGFSGLCFNLNHTGFFAVSDNSGIFEINTNGKTKRKLPYVGTNDFEAITINPANGALYLADEGKMDIYALSSDEQAISFIAHIVVPNAVSNKGLEGLSYADNTFFILNQESPKLLIKYSTSNGAEVSRTQINFAESLSDCFYDNSDHTLWICDSQLHSIFHCTAQGDILASQDISYVPKPEGLVVDNSAHIAWVGCDVTSKLYKIKLKI